MATGPTLPFVPVDHYLNASYHPDKEYVEGVLVERSMPTPGVREIIVLDPDAFVALRYQDGALIEAPIDNLQLPGDRVVPFPVEDLLQELREELG